MNVASKLGAFGLVLAVAVGGGAAVGNAVGPIDDGATEPAADHDEHGEATEEGAAADDEAPATVAADAAVAGLSATSDGYSLVVDDTVVDAPADESFTFHIAGPGGEVVTEFDTRHDRDLHLIVVRADLSGYTHLHPTQDDDGTWSTVLGDLAPGVHRIYADFAAAGGPAVTLGVDITVPGSSVPAPLPAPAATAVTDGYEVALAGSPAAGSAAELTLTVARDGQPVIDLEPYLGAFGHLVAIRSGDLAYLHVHPAGDPPSGADATGGPAVPFEVTVPGPGDYRLFFEFAHEGRTHTAAFTLHVPAEGEQPAAATATTLPGHDDGHEDHG